MDELMEDQQKPAGIRGNSKEDLHIYLHDHVAGAQHAVQLLEALKEAHAGAPVGQFADILLGQVSEDLAVLKGIAGNAGEGTYEMKQLAGWLTDKLSRLKLAPLAKPFHTFEALEFLSLGILGKRALWKALMSVGKEHPELQRIDFVALMDRADSQYVATEEMRLVLAGQAFRAGEHA